MSISQISETLFILTIPFFLKRFGIKTVMTISMVAWFLRFGLFAYGNPGSGLWMIVLSCIVYGMAFDALMGLLFYSRIQRLSRLPLGRIATIEAAVAIALFAAWWLTKGA